MSDQLDNRPVFTIVMGCNGAGKSAWKRENYDRLPGLYIDQDSIAGGVGDWNSEVARERTREIADAQINRAIEQQIDFGMESTYSGLPGPTMVDRVIKAGYRVEGVYMGTDSPAINVARVAYRVEVNTGHYVNPDRLPQRYGHSLANLRKTAEKFDSLEILDNSTDDERHQTRVNQQLWLEKGVVRSQAEPLRDWCATWHGTIPEVLGHSPTGYRRTWRVEQ